MSSPAAAATANVDNDFSDVAISRPHRLRRRRMSAPPPRIVPPRLPPCRPLPLSLEALDLSAASPAQALSSLRFVVLSYLADLERRLSLLESESAEWASTALDMLHAIRADVRSHLPDLLVPDLELHLADLKALLARIDFSRPMSYVPTLSARLKTLHAHLAAEFPSFTRPSFEFRRPSFDLSSFRKPSFDFDFDFDLPDFRGPRDLLDAFRADVDAFLADLPIPSAFLPAAALILPPPAPSLLPTAADALAVSQFGRRLISYDDLPTEWQNNSYVTGGYRFIPLTNYPRIILSLFQLHNETLNIHTHFVPLVLWGAAFYGLRFESSLPDWLWPLRWLEQCVSWAFGGVGGDWARYTPFAATLPAETLPLPFDEALFVIFALACLACSSLWHLMAGCAHLGAMEACARVDYVGIGWLIASTIATVVHHGYACAEQAVDATPLGHTILHPIDSHAGERVVEAAASVLKQGVEGMEALMGMKEVLKGVPDVLLHPVEAFKGAGVGAEVGGGGLVESMIEMLGGMSKFFSLPALSLSLPAFPTQLLSLASWPAYHPVGAACLVLCGVAGVSGNVLPFCAWFNRVENRLWRLGFFVGISFSAIAPLTGIAVLRGWGVMWEFISPVVPSLLYYIMGIFVYATMIPERFVGGRGGWVGWVGDMCGGGSHAIWHVFIVLAIRAHRDGLREMRRAALEGGCAIRGV
ncbi:IZH family channel protein [Favolaschia claudopus]|uniref:IZH family channel protein n=1 Tax=Favolaschia claudopus TaxID=2862362 RepID=A0AAW0A9W0_9AGAR